MALSLRTALFLVACAAPAALFACGSSSGGSGASTTSGTSTGGATGSTTHTGGSTTSGNDAGGDGGISPCQQACITNNQAAYKKFLGYALASCGCTAGAACASACTTDCAAAGDGGASDGGSLSSSCSSCLATQEGEGLGSLCLVSAGATCVGDPSCSAFTSCEQNC
jgi:hypothetical protein